LLFDDTGRVVRIDRSEIESRLVRRMIMRRIGTLLLAVVPVLLIAATAMAADCPKPTDFGNGWTVAAPEQVGLDPALICGIGPRLEALNTGLRASCPFSRPHARAERRETAGGLYPQP
jgi:hypothetical protein